MNEETKVLPLSESLQRFGYGADFKKVFALSAEICDLAKGEDVSEILRKVRRRMYLSGFVDPDELHIDAENHAISEQHLMEGMENPFKDETSEEYTERLRRWRNFFALRVLSIMGERYREKIIGSVSACYSKKPESEDDVDSVIAKYLNGGGSVNVSINDLTPFDQLMDIVGVTDDMSRVK